MPTELMDAQNKDTATPAGNGEGANARPVYVPRTDIYESKEKLVLLADMPGVQQESVDITLERNMLTIVGRVSSPDVEGYNLTYAEYGVGNFRRVFTLSNEVDREGIQASMKDGVLKLILPKSQRAIPKKISIQSH
jgi:HSP20 family protein